MADPIERRPAPVICDGSSGVRLAMVMGGGGPTAPGTEMLVENGWESLLVDGSCRAWVSLWNQPVRMRVLSTERERSLATALRLSEWERFTGAHPGGCPDAGGFVFRFDTQRMSGSTCGLAPADPLNDLGDAFFSQIRDLAAGATDLMGDVRYLVLPEGLAGVGGFSAPVVAWPLDVPIESVAASLPGSSYVRGSSRRATGADASSLRGVRAAATGASGGPMTDFTVVIGAGGARFDLYLRDALPQEGGDGLLPPGTF